eukprot:scaffold29050_cov112-Isochrysis_galbana.AAC.4
MARPCVQAAHARARWEVKSSGTCSVCPSRARCTPCGAVNVGPVREPQLSTHGVSISAFASSGGCRARQDGRRGGGDLNGTAQFPATAAERRRLPSGRSPVGSVALNSPVRTLM